MAFGDHEDDALLRESWVAFCDGLREAGELVFRDAAPATGIDRAEGLRYIARNIPTAFQWTLENTDPLHPRFMRYFEPTRKQGGDNQDALYLGAPIDGEHTYRITGNRGSVAFIAFTVMSARDNGPWGDAVAETLLGDDLFTECDGSFTLTLSPEPRPPGLVRGNWLQTPRDASWLTLRQFFGDWSREQPMAVRIEREGEDAPPPPLTPQRVAHGVRAAAEWLQRSTAMWPEALSLWKARPHEFIAWQTLHTGGEIDATPGGVPLCCYWQVEPDEVLLIEVAPPQCAWWNIEFGNTWWETMDYRYHLSGLNSALSTLEDDGTLRIAVCHDDPGLANWLDPCGHREGYVTQRWVQADSHPVPRCRLIARSALEDAIPATSKRVTPDERRAQLRRRQIGLERRFPA